MDFDKSSTFFLRGIEPTRRKRNHQNHAARLGGFKEVLDK